MNCSMLPGQIHPWLQAAPASRNWQVGWESVREMPERRMTPRVTLRCALMTRSTCCRRTGFRSSPFGGYQSS